MVLRNYERALQRNLLSFTNFLLLLLSLRKRERERDRERQRQRQTQKDRDRERQRETERDRERVFRGIWSKKIPLFDKFFMILEYLHQTILSFNVTIQCFKVMRFCSIYPGNHKKLFWKLIEKRPCLNRFWILFLYKWVKHGLTKNTVTNYLYPGNREKIKQKLTTKNEHKNKN